MTVDANAIGRVTGLVHFDRKAVGASVKLVATAWLDHPSQLCPHQFVRRVATTGCEPRQNRSVPCARRATLRHWPAGSRRLGEWRSRMAFSPAVAPFLLGHAAQCAQNTRANA